MIMGYTEINAKTIDQWVSNGWEWGQYVSHDEYSEAIHGRWSVKLTPVKTVPREWVGKSLRALSSDAMILSKLRPVGVVPEKTVPSAIGVYPF